MLELISCGDNRGKKVIIVVICSSEDTLINLFLKKHFKSC